MDVRGSICFLVLHCKVIYSMLSSLASCMLGPKPPVLDPNQSGSGGQLDTLQ